MSSIQFFPPGSPCPSRPTTPTGSLPRTRERETERRGEREIMMVLNLGKWMGSSRLLSPAVAAENSRRGFVTARRGASCGSVHPRRPFASASSGTHTNVARKRGVELIGVRGSCGPMMPCVSVQVAHDSARPRVLAAVHTHTQRRQLSSRDGFGGGQHFPHSDQVL